MSDRPLVLCVTGKKKSGKTTTVVGLVQALAARGLDVATAKHGHGFDLDTAGTDSWRHRHEGGASRVLMAGPDQMALVGGWGQKGEPTLEALVDDYLADADVVVAEGFRTSAMPRIEVHRAEVHDEPWLLSDPRHRGLCLALLTDVVDFSTSLPILDVHAPDRFDRLADMLLDRPATG